MCQVFLHIWDGVSVMAFKTMGDMRSSGRARVSLVPIKSQGETAPSGAEVRPCRQKQLGSLPSVPVFCPQPSLAPVRYDISSNQVFGWCERWQVPELCLAPVRDKSQRRESAEAGTFVSDKTRVPSAQELARFVPARAQIPCRNASCI